jgi:flagellar hook protein FlgE
MSEISGINSALLGIQRGLAGAKKNAAEIASSEQMDSDSTSDLAKPMVELLENKLQVQASAKVVKTLDETLGSLLDVKA